MQARERMATSFQSSQGRRVKAGPLRPFLMFDEGYDRSIDLQPDTLARDILHALSDEPSSH